MEFTPGQPVIVLDTNLKTAGAGIVQTYNAEADHCLVLFQYPNRNQPESIPVPCHRLIPQPSA
jgi:hypothetical protein